jgi:hypothetical protein
MVKDMPLTWDYIKDKYHYLKVKSIDTNKRLHRILTVKLNGVLNLLEIDTERGISLVDFGSPNTVIHTFAPVKPSSRISPQIEFFNTLKMIQIPNGPEDQEEIEFDKHYKAE